MRMSGKGKQGAELRTKRVDNAMVDELQQHEEKKGEKPASARARPEVKSSGAFSHGHSFQRLFLCCLAVRETCET